MLRTQKIGANKVVGGRVAARILVLALIVGLLVFGYATGAHAAPGDLDPSFGQGGKATIDFVSGHDSGADVTVQDDGKVVVAGGAYTGTATGSDFALARYNPDGSLDTSFGSGGKVTTPIGPSSDYGRAVAVDAKGRIVVAGITFNGADYDFVLARYKPDGAPDATFSDDGIVITPLGPGYDYVQGVALQGTKTVVVGYSNQGATGSDVAVVRYSANGDLDSTFSDDGKVTTDLFDGSSDSANAVALQPGGKIVVAGYSSSLSYDFALARYNADGTLDPTFDADGKATIDFFGGQDEAAGVGLQEDGKIVAAGFASDGTSNSTNHNFALARYNPDGSLDGEFDGDGKTTTDFFGSFDVASDVVVQDDGRIVAAGVSASDFALARYNTDGSLSTSFSNDGRAKTDLGSDNDAATGIAAQTDGKLVVAGYTNNGTELDFALARYFGGNDDVAPRVSAPAQTLQSATLGLSAVPVRISWSATDAQGDVTRYELQRSINGGAYANVALPTSTTATLIQSLTPNRNYRYRVRATDDNGNTSFWKYGPRFAVEAHQETSGSVTYAPSTSWTQQLLGGSYGGQVKFATAAGSTATLTFRGTNAAWVAPKTSTRGQAEVYLDAVKVATVDLSSPKALPRRVVYAANGLAPGVDHTLQVKVLGTAGRPRVDVDAFVVLR